MKIVFLLSVVIQMIRFLFFPYTIRRKAAVVVSEPCFELDEKGKGMPLVVAFSGLGKKYNFVKTLSFLQFNVLYIRDLQHHWYLNGLPGVGGSVSEITSFIKAKQLATGAPYVMTIGVSAGGFAALLYGTLLNAKAIVAFSPQTFMNKFNCVRYFDYRWLDRVLEIYESPNDNKKYLDLKPVVAEGKGKVTLVYDIKHRLDNLHGARILTSNTHHVKEKSAGHSLTKRLREEGRLVQIIEDAFDTPSKNRQTTNP